MERKPTATVRMTVVNIPPATAIGRKRHWTSRIQVITAQDSPVARTAPITPAAAPRREYSQMNILAITPRVAPMALRIIAS